MQLTQWEEQGWGSLDALNSDIGYQVLFHGTGWGLIETGKKEAEGGEGRGVGRRRGGEEWGGDSSHLVMRTGLLLLLIVCCCYQQVDLNPSCKVLEWSLFAL